MISAKHHPIANTAAASLCLMLILFPKGGVRVGEIPVTWGYLLLFASLLGLLPIRMLATKARYVRRQIVALFCVTPFGLLLFYSSLAFGVAFLGGLISTFTSLIFFPLLFLWFYPPLLPLVDRELFLKWFRYTILIAALFGILLFFWRPITGSWIQIPYLTVNGDDAGDFSSTKNIARGAFFKLVSTYNNGNIYGAATLIIFRMYTEATGRKWQRWVIWIALFLTLSRTIWAGMLFDVLLSLGAVLIQQRNSFPVLRLGKAAWITGTVVVLAPVFVILTKLVGVQQRNSFLLDPTLGGRTGQFTNLGSATFFPQSGSSNFFTEITYLSAVNLYGYIGFFTIALLLLSPLIVLLFDRRALSDPYRRAAFKGLLLYALISTSDGALNLIPVMAFYWFTYMIFLFGLPGHPTQHGVERQASLPLLPSPLQTSSV
ncbi:MAG: hypothetical protein ACRYF4_06460 [Janthinobacterium lividum]